MTALPINIQLACKRGRIVYHFWILGSAATVSRHSSSLWNHSFQRRNKLSQIYRRQTFAHYHQPKTLEFLEKDAVRDNENISFWHWRHFLTAAPPPRCGGGGGAREVAYFLNFPGGAVVFFIISGRQRSEFQTIKTGLNCWQVTRH